KRARTWMRRNCLLLASQRRLLGPSQSLQARKLSGLPMTTAILSTLFLRSARKAINPIAASKLSHILHVLKHWPTVRWRVEVHLRAQSHARIAGQRYASVSVSSHFDFDIPSAQLNGQFKVVKRLHNYSG